MHLTTAWLLAAIAAASSNETATSENGIEASAIAAAWSARDSDFAEGSFRWLITDDTFGRFESNWVPVSSAVNEPITGQFDFTGQTVQYRSQSTEYPSYGYPPAVRPVASDIFSAALFQRFSDRTLERRETLPYRISITPDACIHAWDGGVNEFPRAIMLPLQSINSMAHLTKAMASTEDSVEHLSGVPSPVLHQLLTLPLLLTFCPRLFDERLCQPQNWLEIAGSENNAGLTLVALRLPGGSLSDDATNWEFILDSSRDYSVQRATAFVGGTAVAQCDIYYDQYNDGPWIPLKCTVQILSETPSIVRQAVTATRMSCELSKQPSSLVAIQKAIPQKAWVDDRVKGRQFIALNEANYHVSSRQSRLYSYDQILLRATGEQRELQSDRQYLPALLLLTKATRWPGIALTVAALGAVFFCMSRFANRAS